MLRDLAALRWPDAGESVIVYGPVRIDKTHVSQGLGHQVVRRHRSSDQGQTQAAASTCLVGKASFYGSGMAWRQTVVGLPPERFVVDC